METMHFILGIFLVLAVATAVLGASFIVIDMIFSHRISESLAAWYDRKFGVE